MVDRTYNRSDTVVQLQPKVGPQISDLLDPCAAKKYG